jgi:hypothetical protein
MMITVTAQMEVMSLVQQPVHVAHSTAQTLATDHSTFHPRVLTMESAVGTPKQCEVKMIH